MQILRFTNHPEYDKLPAGGRLKYSRRTYIKPKGEGALVSRDRNDCTLRALCNVTGKSYSDLEGEFLNHHQYSHSTGFRAAGFTGIYEKHGVKLIGSFGRTKAAKFFQFATGAASTNKGVTAGTFIRDNPKGKYVLVDGTHAFAVVDGQIVDTGAVNANTRVVLAYKVV